MAEFLEHRWGARFPSTAHAVLNTAFGLLGPARVRDISTSGAFIETPARLPILSRVAAATDAGHEWLEAYVVRSDEDGVAIEWLEPGSRPLALFSGAQSQPRRRPSVSQSIPANARSSGAGKQ